MINRDRTIDALNIAITLAEQEAERILDSVTASFTYDQRDEAGRQIRAMYDVRTRLLKLVDVLSEDVP